MNFDKYTIKSQEVLQKAGIRTVVAEEVEKVLAPVALPLAITRQPQVVLVVGPLHRLKESVEKVVTVCSVVVAEVVVLVVTQLRVSVVLVVMDL